MKWHLIDDYSAYQTIQVAYHWQKCEREYSIRRNLTDNCKILQFVAELLALSVFFIKKKGK